MITMEEMLKRKNLMMVNRSKGKKLVMMKIGAEQVPVHSRLPVKNQHIVRRQNVGESY